ncbi:MAG: hypothetical protein HGB12_00315 [Bacteroidetes bacterium]|nr:hypothetical protein [Bacteroidota bacterium]
MMEIQSHLINSDNNINLYYFLEKLSDHLPDNAVVIADAGSVFFACPQALKLKEGMRYITSSQAEMGFTLPACVGAAVADNRPVIGLTGDGSFQFNIQELITIRNYNLNVKLFVINNGGYLTIKNTSNKFFNGARNGTDFKFPYLLSLSEAYDIRWDLIDDIGLIDKRLDEIINSKNPCICEVMCDPNQVLLPSL